MAAIKRNLFMHRSVNAHDVKEKRKDWVRQLPILDKTPINTPRNTTVLSSIRLNGATAYTTYSGGTTGEKFVNYLKEILLPTLNDGDIIIMDNMRSHHVKEVKRVIDESGKKLLYLPPYSPDFNPIEKMRPKIKAILRKASARNLPALYSAIGEAL